MALQSCLRKSTLLLLLVSLLFSIFAVSSPLPEAEPGYYHKKPKPKTPWYPKPACTCENPPIRKEWRTLTTWEKHSYLKAVQCLASKRTTTISGFPGARNRFDDFHAVHSDQTPNIHWVGFFAIWHRFFIAEYEKALRTECGYEGGQPYWNWSLDVRPGVDFEKSPIFDNYTGFGGNGPYVDGPNPFNISGRSGGGCVPKGPFTEKHGFSVNFGPGANLTYNPHCLTRDFSRPIMESFAQQYLVDQVIRQPDYGWFARTLEKEPNFNIPNIHGSAHFGVGGALGTMGDQYNSPGDPIFYMHHCNLDRIFWEWQKRDLPKRFYDVSGPVIPFDYTNKLGPNITLDFEINLGNLYKNTTLKELLPIEGTVLCYNYD